MKLPNITPGPWTAERNSYGTNFVCGPKDKETGVGTRYGVVICGGNNSDTLSEEDARAIAQVPAMLEVGVELLSFYRRVEGAPKSGSKWARLEAVLRAAGVELEEPTKYRTQQEANKLWSVYYGEGFRKGGFRFEAAAQDWIKRTLEDERVDPRGFTEWKHPEDEFDRQAAEDLQTPDFGPGRMA